MSESIRSQVRPEGGTATRWRRSSWESLTLPIPKSCFSQTKCHDELAHSFPMDEFHQRERRSLPATSGPPGDVSISKEISVSCLDVHETREPAHRRRAMAFPAWWVHRKIIAIGARPPGLLRTRCLAAFPHRSRMDFPVNRGHIVSLSSSFGDSA